MADFFTLACPTCGGQLEITPDVERFACGYCGYQHLVQRRGGIVTLKAVNEALGHIQKNTERTASELALHRLERELRDLQGALAAISTQTALRFTGVLEDYFGEEDADEAGASNGSHTPAALASLTGARLRQMATHFEKERNNDWATYYAVKCGLVDDLRNMAQLKEEIESRAAEVRKHRDIIS